MPYLPLFNKNSPNKVTYSVFQKNNDTTRHTYSHCFSNITQQYFYVYSPSSFLVLSFGNTEISYSISNAFLYSSFFNFSATFLYIKLCINTKKLQKNFIKYILHFIITIILTYINFHFKKIIHIFLPTLTNYILSPACYLSFASLAFIASKIACSAPASLCFFRYSFIAALQISSIVFPEATA